MKYLTHNEIRKIWIRFFEDNKHKLIESAPLIPINDNSLLWTNAGVTPLKKYFDGTVVPDNKRLVSIQKCIRTNDIENVGVTKRHLTFFEMMGNFSIGDYFKEEAIEFGFKCLTDEKYFGIDKNLIYITYYPNDIKTKEKWISLGMNEDHLVPIEGNFWEIGEGPCGPDSEIFFDRGEKYENSKQNSLELFKKDEEQERYVEIWNIVFSQYNSKANQKREEYEELPNKNIDTGAGLERWCMIFQQVDSNFETDLFKPIIKHIEELSNFSYVGQKEYKIIADHIRAITLALADGAFFDNVGRGYVLRRLLRRSVRFGKNLGIKTPFMYKLVSDVVKIFKEAYKEVEEKWAFIETLVLEEEKLFLKTLAEGEKRLKELMETSKDGIISGNDTFKLYDTYGFPFELTEEYLTEQGFKTSKEEFDKYMNIQKELARKNNKNKSSFAAQQKILLDYKTPSTFVYYLHRIKTKIVGILTSEKEHEKLNKDGYLVLERTVFYAEAGGQVSDTGMIIGDNFKARVIDVVKGPNGQNIHKIKLLDGEIKLNDKCEAILDKNRRIEIEKNHSMVHILQHSILENLSKNIKQAGSYLDDKKLRFDFTYNGKINESKILEIENFANEYINKNIIISTEEMPKDKAFEIGAIAPFGEKYSDIVRVVKIGKSIELCGGTHTTNTQNIKSFAITNVESKGSNIYRIEGTTHNHIEKELEKITKIYNEEILKLLLKAKEIVSQAKKEGILLKFDFDLEKTNNKSYKDLIFIKNQLSYLQSEVKELEKKYNDQRLGQVLENLDIYKENEKIINNIPSIIMVLENKEVNLLKNIADSLINNKKLFILFINKNENNTLTFICRNSIEQLNAGLIVKAIAEFSNGNGGGKPTFAQGGGKDITKLDEIIKYVEEQLKNV